MRLLSLFKKKPKKPMTIAEAIESDRPDLNVSEWLQRVNYQAREAKLPLEVKAAILADRSFRK